MINPPEVAPLSLAHVVNPTDIAQATLTQMATVPEIALANLTQMANPPEVAVANLKCQTHLMMTHEVGDDENEAENDQPKIKRVTQKIKHFAVFFSGFFRWFRKLEAAVT